MTLTSKMRARGDAVSTTVPTEARRRMGLNPGDELYWVENGAGGYHVSPVNPQRAAMLRAHAEVMAEYRDIFAALAE